MRFSNYFLIPSSASFDKYKNSVTLLLNNFLFFITFYEIAKILRRISQNYSIISKNKRINKRSKLLLMTSILFFFFHFFFFHFFSFFYREKIKLLHPKRLRGQKKNRSVTRWKKKKKIWPFFLDLP